MNLWIFRNVRMFKGKKQILLFLLLLSKHLDYVVNAQVTTLSTAKCDYLVSEDGQYNAYLHNHRLCCMCAAGLYLLDHCGEDSPDSTMCKECPYNETDPNDRYHIPYGPHMLTKCERQFPVFCQRDEILVEGSTSRRPKCISKPNEAGTKTMATTTEKSLLTRILQTVGNHTESSRDIEHVTSDGLNQESDDTKFKYTKSQGSTSVTREFEMTTPPPPLSTMQDDETTAKHGKKKYAVGSWYKIATTIIGVICLLCLTLCIRWKNKKKKRKLISLEQVSINSKVDEVHIVEGRVQAESPSLIEAGPPQINTDHGNAVPETQPILRVERHEREDDARNDDQVSDTGEEDNQPLLRPVNNGNSSSSQQPEILERNQDTNKNLIMKMATIIPKCINRKEVLPIFRTIIGLEAEPDFEDMDKKYRHDTPEFIFQLVLYCTRILGNKFTPEYFLQNLQTISDDRQPGLLIDRIEEIIRENPVQ